MADAQPSVVLQQGNVTVVLQESASQPPQPSDLTLGSAAALLALLTAGSIAQRRRRDRGGRALRRLRRILDPGLLFAAAFTLWLVATELYAPASGGSLLIVASFAMVIVSLIAMAFFGALDLWLFRYRPIRSWRWLLAAILAFGGVTELAVVAALVSGGDFSRLQDPAQLPIALMAMAAGLTWWSYLPQPRHDLAQLFE